MGRHGSRYKYIKKIIYRSPKQNFVYELNKNGKHITNMKRATRTIYKKKEIINQRSDDSELITSTNSTNNPRIDTIIQSSQTGNDSQHHFLELDLESSSDDIRSFEVNNSVFSMYQDDDSNSFDMNQESELFFNETDSPI